MTGFGSSGWALSAEQVASMAGPYQVEGAVRSILASSSTDWQQERPSSAIRAPGVASVLRERSAVLHKWKPGEAARQ